MKKKYIIAIGIILLVVLGVAISLLFTGPHMENAECLRTFEKSELLPPPHSIPTEKLTELPADNENNPLENTPENFNKGKVYYSYYCVFCHGIDLDGNGPVGKSYIPKPADLRIDKIKNEPDGQMVKNMLTGIGHTPVLERVVPYKFWWYIALYVKNYKSETTLSDFQDTRHDSSVAGNKLQRKRDH